VGIRAASPINIWVDDQIMWPATRERESKTVLHSAFDISQNAFDESKMGLTGVMHIQANLLDGMSNVRPCERQVL